MILIDRANNKKRRKNYPFSGLAMMERGTENVSSTIPLFKIQSSPESQFELKLPLVLSPGRLAYRSAPAVTATTISGIFTFLKVQKTAPSLRLRNSSSGCCGVQAVVVGF